MARENAFELFSFRSASSKCQFIHSVWKHHNKLWYARARSRRHWIEQFHFNSFVVVIFSFIKRKFRNKTRRSKNVENIFHSFVRRKRVKKALVKIALDNFFIRNIFFRQWKIFHMFDYDYFSFLVVGWIVLYRALWQAGILVCAFYLNAISYFFSCSFRLLF